GTALPVSAANSQCQQPWPMSEAWADRLLIFRQAHQQAMPTSEAVESINQPSQAATPNSQARKCKRGHKSHTSQRGMHG
ncbi:MAG: hypothetical protein P4L50_13520, partial [Anaerolineaceae bacterium]|nr:hypothetical protein [Anaerolineaceae bacterium]